MSKLYQPLILAAITVLALGGAAPADADPASHEGGEGRVRTESGRLRVRAEPDLEAPVIHHLENESALRVLEKSEDGRWLLVEQDGKRGWVSVHHVEMGPEPAAEAAAASAAHVPRATYARAGSASPRLVLTIVVDQLRGDLPLRYRDRLAGGLRYLLERGTWYASAYHPHSHTETVVGHTTVVTGTYPSRHGMVGNSWFDVHSGVKVDCVEDLNHKILGCIEGTCKQGKTGAECDRCENRQRGLCDPTLCCKGGASPNNILTTTLSDELTLATNGRAKNFGVSIKDRAAVALAGHTGTAYWFSLDSGGFVTSDFYADAYPDWVKTWNAGKPVNRYGLPAEWKLSGPKSGYLYEDITNEYKKDTSAEDNMEALDKKIQERGLGFKRIFSHTMAPAQVCPLLYNGLTLTSFGDILTLDFVKNLIKNEDLGGDEVTDHLGIGFSVTDIIGHWFSPASLESEENILRLDCTLADLFAFIDDKIGLENTLISLAGDHGMPEFPQYLEKFRINADIVTPDEIDDKVKAVLSANSWPQDILRAKFSYPYLYLDSGAIESAGLDQETVERAIAKSIMTLDGVDLAVSSTAMRRGAEETDRELIDQIRRNYNPERSGDIYVVQRPEWQVQEVPAPGESYNPGTILLQHGSPWTYDTYVPLVFAGAGVPSAMVFRKVYTVDVAPTVAAFLGIRAPSGTVGSPLVEALEARRLTPGDRADHNRCAHPPGN